MAPLAAVLSLRNSGQTASVKINPVFLDVWIYLNLVTNTILLPLLVATFLLSKGARRHPTLVNVCITWIFSGIFSLLLFYAGQHKGPEPSPNLCIAQAALLNGITPMWSVAIFMMSYYINATIGTCSQGYQIGKIKMIIMLAAPYVTQLAFSLATLTISLAHPERVSRNRGILHCTLESERLRISITMFTLLVCLGILILKVELAMATYKSWRIARRTGHQNNINFPLIVRVLIFGVYVFSFGVVANLIDMADPTNPVPEIYAATGGTVILLIFGTQADVFRAWCFSDPLFDHNRT